jgi:hypothetical protein
MKRGHTEVNGGVVRYIETAKGGQAKPDGDGLFGGQYPAEYPQFSELPE